MTLTKNIFIKSALLTLLSVPLLFGMTAHAASPTWNVAGTYVVAFNYLGNDYGHDVTLAQSNTGAVTGNGGSPVGANTYTWVVTSGSVSGNTVDLYANYTATADAVTPLTTMHMAGTVALDGTMAGTWSDNYQGGAREGTWRTTSGVAAPLLGTLAAEDFGVVINDAGALGIVKGYTAGFGLTGATFAGAQSVVVKLYNGTTLLQTNTAILPKFNADITGTQFSAPFDVSGTFNYATDGYWVHVRESQYGQSVPATKVVATVTLANGKVVTAENMTLNGNPTTIYPVVVPPTTSPTMKNQCKNGGWKTFTNPSFKNQGKCVSFVEHLSHGHDNDDDEDEDDDKKDGHGKRHGKDENRSDTHKHRSSKSRG
jgi:hypothetical protein